MKRTLSRLLTMAVALPLAATIGTGTASANHSVTVPGCYGAGTSGTVICNLTVTVGVPVGAETYQTTVPVCAGTCQQVPVTLARTTPGEPTRVCYSYNTLGGLPQTTCYDAATIVDNYVNFVLGAVENALNTVNYQVYRYCNTAANALDNYEIYIYCQ